MQVTQSLTSKLHLERANQNRIGNPRLAEQDYINAAKADSVEAYFQLISDYESGFYDGIIDNQRALTLIFELANLLQKNYQQLFLADTLAVNALFNDVDIFLKKFSSKIEHETSLLSRLQEIHLHIQAIHLFCEQKSEDALKKFDEMAKVGNLCGITHLAKSCFERQQKGVNNLVDALTYAIDVVKKYHNMIANNHIMNPHTALAVLESIEIIYELSCSLNNVINQKANSFLDSYENKKIIAMTLHTYSQHEDRRLRNFTRYIEIQFTNEFNINYEQELLLQTRTFMPTKAARTLFPQDIYTIYKPFHDHFIYRSSISSKDGSEFNLRHLEEIQDSPERIFFASVALANIYSNRYEYGGGYSRVAMPDSALEKYHKAYLIYQDDIDVILGLINYYANYIKKGDQAYIIPYICLMGSGLNNCHSEQCLNMLKMIYTGDAKLYDYSHKILVKFFIAYYHLKNARDAEAFIIFHNIIHTHSKQNISAEVIREICKQLMIYLPNAIENKRFRIAKRVLEFIIHLNRPYGLIKLLNFYSQGLTDVIKEEYNLNILNQIAVSLWQQILNLSQNGLLTDTLEALEQSCQAYQQTNPELASQYAVLKMLHAGIVCEQQEQQNKPEERAAIYLQAFNNFKTAHEHHILLGTLKFAIANELNYQGIGARVLEAINLYNSFLSTPLLRKDINYLPAIIVCCRRLLELSSHPRVDISKPAIDVLLAHADLCTDEQIKKMLAQFNGPPGRIVCFEQLVIRQNLLRNMPAEILLELSAYGFTKYKQAAHAVFLMSSDRYFDAIKTISETTDHPYQAYALNVLGLLAHQGKIGLFFKIQPWRNEDLIKLKYFMQSLNLGCTDALLNALSVIEKLFTNPQLVNFANNELATILSKVLEKNFAIKLNVEEQQTLSYSISKLKFNKLINKELHYLLDQIIENIGTSSVQRRLERWEEVDGESKKSERTWISLNK